MNGSTCYESNEYCKLRIEICYGAKKKKQKKKKKKKKEKEVDIEISQRLHRLHRLSNFRVGIERRRTSRKR